MTGLALALQVANLLDEDGVDLKERSYAVLVSRLCDGRHRRGRHRFHRCLGLGRLGLDLVHGLLLVLLVLVLLLVLLLLVLLLLVLVLAVGGEGAGRMLCLGRCVRLAGGAGG